MAQSARMKKNVWNNKTSICDSSTMAIVKGKPPTPPASLRPPGRIQHPGDVNEENVLKTHVKHNKSHAHVKEKLKQQSKKTDDVLLMNNTHLYRTRIEHADNLHRSKRVEDRCSGEQLWEMSLRDNWSVVPRIGDLYSAPIHYFKEYVVENIEQIGYPNKANLYDLMPDMSNPKSMKEHSTFTAFKRHLDKSEKILGKKALFKPKFLGLEVVGKRLTMSSSLPELVEISGPSKIKELETTLTTTPLEPLEPEFSGPSAELNQKTLFFSGRQGESKSLLVTLRNTGSTILFFQWLRQSTKTLWEDKIKGIEENVCVTPESGSIQPTEKINFYFSFHASSPGIFLETWILNFAPRLSIPLQQLSISGVVTIDDQNSLKRKRLSQRLDIQQRTHCVEDIISNMVETSALRGRSSYNKKIPDFVYSKDNFKFQRCNELFGSPLYYFPNVASQFEKIAIEVAQRSSSLVMFAPQVEEGKGTSEAKVEIPPIEILPPSDKRRQSESRRQSEIRKQVDKRRKSEGPRKSLTQRQSLVPQRSPQPETQTQQTLETQTQQTLETKQDSLTKPAYPQIITENKEWNMCISNLILYLDHNPRVDEQLRDTEKLKLNNLIDISTFPYHPTCVLHHAMHKALSQFVNQMEVALEVIQKPPQTEDEENETENKEVNEKVVTKDNAQRNEQDDETAGEGEYTAQFCGVVRSLLNDTIEQFFGEIEANVKTLIPLSEQKMQLTNEKHDEESASWTSFWLERLKDSLFQ